MKKVKHSFYLPDQCYYLLQNETFYCCISYMIDREDWWDKCIHNSLGWIDRNRIFDNGYVEVDILNKITGKTYDWFFTIKKK